MKAALLVDWENVRSALDEQGYHCRESGWLAPKLIETARSRAAGEGISLDYAAFFAPPIAVPERTRQDLVNAGLDPVYTPEGPQAADAALIAQAFDLVHSGYVLFFIVANDAGFVQTARQLGKNHASCYLWPLNEKKIRPEVRAWHLTEYLVDLLGPGAFGSDSLKPCPPPPADALRLFILACELLITQGKSLWSYPKAISYLVELQFLGNDSDVKTLWAQAQSRGYFKTDQAIVSGNPVPSRRLAYENRDVHRLLVVCDALLMAIGRSGAGMAREDAFAVLNHPLLEKSGETAEILNLLVRAGFIHDGDLVTLTEDRLKFGMLSALRRVSLIAWSQSEEESNSGNGSAQLSKTKIARHWPQHAAPRRRLPQAVFHTLREEGNRFVRAAEAAGVLVRHQDTNTYSLRDTHPVVRSTKATVCAMIGLLAKAGASERSIHQDVILAAMGGAHPSAGAELGWTPNDYKTLLGMLAAENVITWSHESIQLRPGSGLVKRCMAGS